MRFLWVSFKLTSLCPANQCCSELPNTNGHSSPNIEEQTNCHGGGVMRAKEQASDTHGILATTSRFCTTMMA